MESEKVKEIKKALKNCQKNNCLDCPYFIDEKMCRANDLLFDTITLINELESENEKLKNDYLTQARLLGQMGYNDIQECKKLKERIAELEKENGKLNIELDKRDCIDYPCRLIEKEHLKQFAERLKEKMGVREYMGVKYKQGVFSENDIDETLKQMLGEE